MIDTQPDEFRHAISFYPKQRCFIIEGDTYKKVLDPGKTEEILNWYQRKNLYLVCNRGFDHRLFSHELVRDLTEGFGLLADFYHYLMKIKEKERASMKTGGAIERGIQSAKKIATGEKPPLSREEGFKKSLELTERSEIAMVGSIENDGYPNIKAMFKIESEGLNG